jgi:hypothetical protein
VVRPLYAGEAVSLIGSGASTVAFPVLVLALTHSPWLAGLVGAVRLVPYAVLGMLAGVVVDRWERGRVLLGCEAGRILLLGSLPLAALLGHVTWVQVALVALLEGTCFTFFDLGLTATLPQLVPEEQLGTVANLHLMVTNSAQLLGPPLGGWLFGLGSTLPMLADALSYLVSLGSLWRVRGCLGPVRPSRTRAWEGGVGTDLRAGLGWLWHHPPLRDLALVCAGANLALSAYPLLLVLAARQISLGPAGTGLIVGAAGLGGVLGPVIAARRPSGWSLAAVGGGSLLLTALCWLGTTAARAPISLGVWATAAMSAEQAFNGAQFALRLRLIPRELQGRLQALYRLLLMLAQPMGVALLGGLAGVVGVRGALLMGAGLIGAVAVATTVDPALAGRSTLRRTPARVGTRPGRGVPVEVRDRAAGRPANREGGALLRW